MTDPLIEQARMANDAAALLRSSIDYDGATGEFFWRERPVDHFATARVHKSWNRQFAGRPVHVGRDKDGYGKIRIGSHYFKAHRAAWLLTYGAWPRNEVDHISGDRRDNRISNLRDVSKIENRRNQSRRRDNTSGVTGVRRHEGRWRAEIHFQGKCQSLGRFAVFEDAVKARKAAEARLGYHPNHGRTQGAV